MPDHDDSAKDRQLDDPTRLQRAARRGCAGLAYAIVLVPVVLGIWFFSTIPRGWEQFGDLVWNILWSPGADTEIVVFNHSGQDVDRFVIRYADEKIWYNGLLEAYRGPGVKQKARHFKKMFWRPIRPKSFRTEIVYSEVAGNHPEWFVRCDRRPRPRCRFVFVLEAHGPVLSECQRPEAEDFRSG